MNINVTLFGEMLTFAVLVWVMMKYIWPPLIKAIEERQQKIVTGLDAAERGKQELVMAQNEITNKLRQTKIEASKMLDDARHQASEVLDQTRITAEKERARIIAQAKLEVAEEMKSAEQILRQQAVDLVIATTEKVLQKQVNNVIQKKWIAELISSV